MLGSLGEDSPAEKAGQASMPSKVPGWIRTTNASHLGSFIPNEEGETYQKNRSNMSKNILISIKVMISM